MKKLALVLVLMSVVLSGIWVSLALSGEKSRPAPNAFAEAAALFARGEHARAHDVLLIYCETHPEHVEAALLFAQICLESGRAKKAEETLEKLKNAGKASGAVAILQSRIAVRMGQAGRAAAPLREAVGKEPNDPRLWRELAFVQYVSGETQQALASANRSLKIDPSQEDLAQLASEITMQAAMRTGPQGFEPPKPGAPQTLSPFGRFDHTSPGAPVPVMPNPSAFPQGTPRNGWPR